MADRIDLNRTQANRLFDGVEPQEHTTYIHPLPSSHQPHLAPQLRLHAATQLLRAHVQPHDCVVQRLPCALVPHHGRLALVGDAQGLDVHRTQLGFCLLRSACIT